LAIEAFLELGGDPCNVSIRPLASLSCVVPERSAVQLCAAGVEAIKEPEPIPVLNVARLRIRCSELMEELDVALGESATEAKQLLWDFMGPIEVRRGDDSF
jgi:hypothetical protein